MLSLPGPLTSAMLLTLTSSTDAAAAAATAAAASSAPPGQVTVSVGDTATPLSPVLYSAFLETEINFGGEGGLYAEQIRNRDFEALGRGDFGDFGVPMSTAVAADGPNQTPGLAPDLRDHRPWLPVGGAAIAVENTTAPFASNPTTLRLSTSAAGGGISNPGYWGVACGAGCNLSFWAKPAAGGNADRRSAQPPLSLTARLRAPDGALISSSPPIALSADGRSWQRYNTTLPAPSPASKRGVGAGAGTFELVVASGAGELQLDAVSLMPSDAIAGCLRRDIVEQLKQLQAGFIRTPGGSYIIGNGPLTQYNWKQTVGEPAARPGYALYRRCL
jgi:alpha-N-arabinofuranosidase